MAQTGHRHKHAQALSRREVVWIGSLVRLIQVMPYGGTVVQCWNADSLETPKMVESLLFSATSARFGNILAAY